MTWGFSASSSRARRAFITQRLNAASVTTWRGQTASSSSALSTTRPRLTSRKAMHSNTLGCSSTGSPARSSRRRGRLSSNSPKRKVSGPALASGSSPWPGGTLMGGGALVLPGRRITQSEPPYGRVGPLARRGGYNRVPLPDILSRPPNQPESMSHTQDDFKQAALDYHRQAPAGKIKVSPTKALITQRDLSLAYSPGVAAACEAIVADPGEASALTARGNLVGVITNGTAVLGLGDIGPLAGKPVMEGKGVLFQKFAGIDVFDLEVAERDPDKLVEIIAALEPTFGGINLEDIKAPECFIVEKTLRERMKIPVFHDDQHGTAIIVGAALLNALKVVDKQIGDVKLAVSGAGAAGIACLDMAVALGVKPEHILVADRDGVLHAGRADLQPGGGNHGLARYARDTRARSLPDIVRGADVFIGVSAGNILSADMVKSMAERPVIFALANPTPEIDPALARQTRPDAVIATGRSDHPNQVNNALCFPYIFRGAPDVGAPTLNEKMKLACVHAIAELARREATDLGAAYGGDTPHFGPDYLIPRPFDPRLLMS